LIRCVSSSLGLVFVTATLTADAGQDFHTNPYCWDEARIVAASGPDDYEILLSRIDSELPEPSTLSPNKAYAFHLADGIWNETEQSWHREILVDIERPYLLKLVFPGVRDMHDVRWINERLLFVRAWRGRIAGSDFIINIESEIVAHQERFYWGQAAFQQAQACAEQEWADLEQCQCDE